MKCYLEFYLLIHRIINPLQSKYELFEKKNAVLRRKIKHGNGETLITENEFKLMFSYIKGQEKYYIFFLHMYIFFLSFM